MNVLYWSEVFWPTLGGAELFAARLLRTLGDRGYAFTVVTERGRDLPERQEFAGAEIYRFPFHATLAGGDLDRVIGLRQEIKGLQRRVQPALIHLNTLRRGTFFLVDTGRSSPAPLLVSLHDCLPIACGRPDTLLRNALGSAARITCCSRFVLSGLAGQLPELEARAAVLYYGIEPPAWPPGPRPVAPAHLLCVGRLAPEKGFDLALRAFALLGSKFPEARLTIAGDGPCRSALERLARALGVERRVLFPGWVEPGKVWPLMNEATVVAIPSRWEEPFGLVALEAAFMARPVVAARAGGLPEAFEEGVTGLGVAREDPVGLAEALISLLEQPERATAMGLAARQRACELFSWERCADAYDREYRKTIAVQ